MAEKAKAEQLERERQERVAQETAAKEEAKRKAREKAAQEAERKAREDAAKLEAAQQAKLAAEKAKAERLERERQLREAERRTKEVERAEQKRQQDEARVRAAKEAERRLKAAAAFAWGLVCRLPWYAWVGVVGLFLLVGALAVRPNAWGLPAPTATIVVGMQSSPSPAILPTAMPTPSLTLTAMPKPTDTPTSTATQSPTTATPTNTPTPTFTPTITLTPTSSPKPPKPPTLISASGKDKVEISGIWVSPRPGAEHIYVQVSVSSISRLDTNAVIRIDLEPSVNIYCWSTADASTQISVRGVETYTRTCRFDGTGNAVTNKIHVRFFVYYPNDPQDPMAGGRIGDLVAEYYYDHIIEWRR